MKALSSLSSTPFTSIISLENSTPSTPSPIDKKTSTVFTYLGGEPSIVSSNTIFAVPVITNLGNASFPPIPFIDETASSLCLRILLTFGKSDKTFSGMNVFSAILLKSSDLPSEFWHLAEIAKEKKIKKNIYFIIVKFIWLQL